MPIPGSPLPVPQAPKVGTCTESGGLCRGPRHTPSWLIHGMCGGRWPYRTDCWATAPRPALGDLGPMPGPLLPICGMGTRDSCITGLQAGPERPCTVGTLPRTRPTGPGAGARPGGQTAGSVCRPPWPGRHGGVHLATPAAPGNPISGLDGSEVPSASPPQCCHCPPPSSANVWASLPPQPWQGARQGRRGGGAQASRGIREPPIAQGASHPQI